MLFWRFLSSWLVSNISLWWPDLVRVGTSGLWNRSWAARWPRPLGAMIRREQDGFLPWFQSSVIWPSYKVFQNIHFIGILSFIISSAIEVTFLQIFVYFRYFLGVLLLLSLMAMVPVLPSSVLCVRTSSPVIFVLVGVFINKPSGGYFMICNTSSSYLSIMAQLGQFCMGKMSLVNRPLVKMIKAQLFMMSARPCRV